MVSFKCLSALLGKKKKTKGVKNEGDQESSKNVVDQNRGHRTVQVKLEHPLKSSKSEELNTTSFSVSVPFDIKGNSTTCKVKVMSHESPMEGEAVEVAYEGEDEHEDNSSIKREFSDFDLQAHVANAVGEEESRFGPRNMKYSDSLDVGVHPKFEDKAGKDAEKSDDVLQNGHVSDPGIPKADFWASPKLKRSCSNLETRDVLKKVAAELPPSKTHSFEELGGLADGGVVVGEEFFQRNNPGSLGSITSRRSADRVMLKKHSSSQVLPSRSRRLWWKLFLWSHRNLHKPSPTKLVPLPIIKQQGGYCSDTIEMNQGLQSSELESPGSFTGDNHRNDNQSWDGFHGRTSGLWPQNHWVAFSGESSPFSRVDEWVKELEVQPPFPVDNDDDNNVEGITFPPSPETSRSPARTRHPNANLSEEILHANSVIQSLNSSSTVAHISGIGLKVIPAISHFSSLRSVNLSSNSIVHITPGSLPKALHVLNLSRNKVSTIEGLRELTRLRVLDLSYNRISRIGHGLSNCTLIKELYLAGNKISDLEGLHRLLKLTVLDVSFNKITTTNALGQLVANYNSLLALNLLGNPIQSNISDDQVRKAVGSLLPKLSYLNKQPIKPQRAREVATDSVAKAALGYSGQSSHRRRATRRVSQAGSLVSGGHRSSSSAGHRSKTRSKSRTHYQSPLGTAQASSSR